MKEERELIVKLVNNWWECFYRVCYDHGTDPHKTIALFSDELKESFEESELKFTYNAVNNKWELSSI